MSTREEFWRGALSELSASCLSMRQFLRERPPPLGAGTQELAILRQW